MSNSCTVAHSPASVFEAASGLRGQAEECELWRELLRSDTPPLQGDCSLVRLAVRLLAWRAGRGGGPTRPRQDHVRDTYEDFWDLDPCEGVTGPRGLRQSQLGRAMTEIHVRVLLMTTSVLRYFKAPASTQCARVCSPC